MRLAFAFALAGFVFVMGSIVLLTTGRPVEHPGRLFQEVLFFVGVGSIALSSARGFGVALAAIRAHRSSAGALTWAFAMLAVALFLVSITHQNTTSGYGPSAQPSLSGGQAAVWAAVACAFVSMIAGFTGVTRAVSRR